MLKYELGCELNYSIDRASTLILNIGVVSSDCQTIFHEDLKVEPRLKIEEYITSVARNRYFRLNAPPGNLQISYRATIGLSHYYSDPIPMLFLK
jgi:hypothetical protein